MDARTLKSHRLQDRTAIARADANHAISAHEADIVEYISSMTLTDKVSGALKYQGGRLWSKSDPDPQDLVILQGLSSRSPEPSSPSFSLPPNRHNQEASSCEASRRIRVDSHIRHLAGIKASVAALSNQTSKELADLASHFGDPSTVFPLKPLLSVCADLRNQLNEVKGKQAAVVETKRTIVEQLDHIQDLLDKAKRDWKQKWVEYSAAATMAAENELNTGLSPSLHTLYVVLISIIDHHFIPFLQNVDPILQVSLFMVVACHIVLNISRRGCNFMLSMLQYVVQLALMRITPNLSTREQKLMSDFPVDPRSATAQFRLDGKSVIYAVCPNPKCYHT